MPQGKSTTSAARGSARSREEDDDNTFGLEIIDEVSQATQATRGALSSPHRPPFRCSCRQSPFRHPSLEGYLESGFLRLKAPERQTRVGPTSSIRPGADHGGSNSSSQRKEVGLVASSTE